MNEDIREEVRQKYAQAIKPTATELEQLNGSLVSAFIRAKKGGTVAIAREEFCNE